MPQSLSKMIFRGASLALLGRLVFVVAGFTITSITALWYGAGVVGVVATMTTVVTFLGILANAGTSTSINSYVTSPFAAGAVSAARKAYRRIIAICLMGALLLAVTFVLMAGNWAEQSLDGIAGMTPAMVLILTALAVPLRVLSEMTTLAMRTLDRIPAFVVLIVAPALINLLVLIAGIWSGQGPDAAVWGFFAGLGVAAIIGLVWVARVFDRNSRSPVTAPPPTAAPQVESPVAMMRHSFPMLISTIGSYGVTASGLLIMSNFATPAETGHYSVALRLATVTSLVLTSINAITTPIFARLHAAGETAQLVTVARRTSRLMFWMVLPIIFFLVILGRPLLGLAFGPEFQDAYVPMLVILAGQLVNAATGPSDFVMNMTGMHRILRNIISLAAIAAVALGFVLVPLFGAMGAAITYALSLSAWNMVSALILRRRFGTWIGYLPFLADR